jgi:hypothetical protein
MYIIDFIDLNRLARLLLKAITKQISLNLSQTKTGSKDNRG